MQDQHLPANPSRRRLAKAGAAAAPVVLASLASKSAFAAVPYQLTISGQMSGNMSPRGTTTTTQTISAVPGNSSASVLSLLQNDGTNFAAVGFSNLYFENGDNNTATALAASKIDNSWKKASLYNVLRLNSYSGNVLDPELAKMAVVLYKNAQTFGGDQYPLTTAQVTAMFNAAINGQPYTGSTSLGQFTWTPSQVKTYFSKLYF